MAIDKTNVARHQLGTALALFVEDLASRSVHVLASGSGAVAEQLARVPSKSPLPRSHGNVPRSENGDIRRIRNPFWNAFKHATIRAGTARADEELLMSFADRQNEHALFIGWYDYMMAVNQLPVEAQVFQIGYPAP